MSDARWGDPRAYAERDRDDGRPRVYEERDRDDYEPRASLMHDLDLPRGEERELVVDRDRIYELNGDDSRTLAAVGAFRVVPAQDLDIDHETLDHLRDEGLVDVVDLGVDERGVTLTRDGRDLVDSHVIDRGDAPSQAFYAGVGRPREIHHDSNLYATYRQEESRLRDEHGDLDIRRVILEQDLKREYQEFLQEHNRNRSDSDGRPGRDEDEIGTGARARPAVLRRPGALPRLPHRVQGRWAGTPRRRRAVYAALPRRPRRQPREDRLPHHVADSGGAAVVARHSRA